MTLQVGLTGGIASGKSSVSRQLSAAGVTVIDYDQLARDVVEPGTAGLDAIAARFGHQVLTADGQLDRPALAAIVFTDPQARRDLEAITHPAIRELAAAKVAVASGLVVHDNPLLIEMGGHQACDLVVVVDAPVEQQISRMVSDRGMTEREAQQRIDTQLGRPERCAAADIIIDNSGTLAELEQRVAELIKELKQRAVA